MSGAWEPSTQKGMFANLAIWVIGLVILVGAIAVGLWTFGVFTSNVQGAGEAIKQRNSAVNRIEKQEMFVQLNADIDGYLAKIKIAAATYKASPTDTHLTELTGLRQQCVDTVQQYNAESQKFTSRDFKSADLPYTRDPADCG